MTVQLASITAVLVLIPAGCGVHVNVLEPASASPCAVALSPVDTSHPDAVVGDGTPESCTEAALNAALETGGVIRFHCGASPLIIPVTAEKVILRDTVVDGGSTVTLDGGGASRIFVVGVPGDRVASLTLQYLTLRRGHAAMTPASAGSSSRTGGGAIVQFGGSLVITDSVLGDNDATASGDAAGGAVCSVGGRLAIARSSFDGNRAGSAGAVAAMGSKLVLVRTRLTNNQAVGLGNDWQGIGGALLADQEGQSVAMCQVTMSGNQSTKFGSAVHLQGIGGETMTIEEAAFLDNVVPDVASSMSSGPAVFLGIVEARLTNVTVARNRGSLAPGVWVNGGSQPSQAATIHMTNVTIADNQVYRRADPTTDGVGAALWIDGAVNGTLDNCTLAGNVGEFGAGIIHPGQLTIRNSIIANQGTNTGSAQNCSDLVPALVPAQGDHVLQWPSESLANYACVAGVTVADPQLGPLQDNGGYAPTMMPAASSPAVSAGVDCSATDQRGHARPARCTLGAVEADGGASGCPTCSVVDWVAALTH
jgi:hypothetical protein